MASDRRNPLFVLPGVSGDLVEDEGSNAAQLSEISDHTGSGYSLDLLSFQSEDQDQATGGASPIPGTSSNAISTPGGPWADFNLIDAKGKQPVLDAAVGIRNVSEDRPRSRSDFEMAIVCALKLEAEAVLHLFDRFWDDDGGSVRQSPW
ncbi:hypothetical protein QBC35DRAFT_463608 [Podospora australis]|uniref:Uncharacterized protein n=1 Tax=Podospora australis TaxID=1536484 RepID=A0AAN6WW91_9PEZI|nr:hypothetical protein QBC35DRAFT_463608 [Podospora australis]